MAWTGRRECEVTKSPGPHLGCRVLGLLLALTAAGGHELPDGDSVLEGWLVHRPFDLDQVVLRGQSPPDVQLLES